MTDWVLHQMESGRKAAQTTENEHNSEATDSNQASTPR